MYKIKNRRHKPLYKKFIALRTNVQLRMRLYALKFKKKKMGKIDVTHTSTTAQTKKKFQNL